MKNLHARLASLLSPASDAPATVVFPSEIAAEYWRRSVLRHGELGAVREDRIISWDTFKEQAFEIREDVRPVNRTIRTVFAEQVLAENAGSPFLQALVPREYADDARRFAQGIVAVLPSLRDALSVIPEGAGGRLRRLRTDLSALLPRYSAYLDTHDFFEPGWLVVDERFRGGEYLLVAPDLADDYHTFAGTLSATSAFQPTTPDRVLTIYPDSRSELRAVLLEVARLLDEGCDPDEIVLSVGGLDQAVDRIAQEARKHDVPLMFRTGRTLADRAVGRFFRDIGDAVTSGFGTDALGRVLLNQAIPWVSRRQAAGLILSGIEAGVLGGGREPDPRWKRVGRRRPRPGDAAGEAEQERALFADLRRLLPRVAQARSFADLRTALRELLRKTVDPEGWEEPDERVLERCQEELGALVDLEEATGLTVDQPYRFWLDRLGEQRYVPRDRAPGVSVLSYKVGACIDPAHHFVLNASQEATEVIVRRFPFLGDSERDQLGNTWLERDLSGRFLDVYAASGANVTFSASRESWDGIVLPAGTFVARGATREVPESRLAVLRADDSFLVEERSGETPAPMPLQVLGVAAHLAGARDPHVVPDLTKEPISRPETRELVVSRHRSEDAPHAVTLSASRIDAFRACPFSYLFLRALGIEELSLAVSPDNALDLGNLYHQILADFFAELQSADRRFSPDALPEYEEVLERLADERYARRRGMAADIVFGANRGRWTRVVRALLQCDAQLIGGHAPHMVEEELSAELYPGVRIVGRFDRVTRAPDGTLVLVDYKKSGIPGRRDVNAGSVTPVGEEADPETEESVLSTLQIPLYLRLLEARGHAVSAAGYYSLEKGAYLSVFGSPGCDTKSSMTRERLTEVLELVDRIVPKVAQRITRGDFSCGDGCDQCSLQGLCRTGFVVG
jgi:hypothetical protein